jgi:hypothetical protein
MMPFALGTEVTILDLPNRPPCSHMGRTGTLAMYMPKNPLSDAPECYWVHFDADDGHVETTMAFLLDRIQPLGLMRIRPEVMEE